MQRNGSMSCAHSLHHNTPSALRTSSSYTSGVPVPSHSRPSSFVSITVGRSALRMKTATAGR
eukprot:51500-Eustigmatos_ZCMA.PRE.1